MSRISIRNTTYEMQGADRVLRLRKWSAGKFISIVSDIADVIDDAMVSLEGQQVSREKLYARLTVAFCRSTAKLTRVVRDSVEDPKLKDEEIQEWDMEDLLGVLAEILKLNLTENLQKNAMALLQAALPKAATEPMTSTTSTREMARETAKAEAAAEAALVGVSAGNSTE